MTCFCTWLHAFPDQPFYSVWVKISIYAKLCAERRFYVRLLEGQSKQYFPTMCSEVLVNSGHQTRLCERGCTDLVHFFLASIFFSFTEFAWVRPIGQASQVSYASEAVLIFTPALAMLISMLINLKFSKWNVINLSNKLYRAYGSKTLWKQV